MDDVNKRELDGLGEPNGQEGGEMTRVKWVVMAEMDGQGG